MSSVWVVVKYLGPTDTRGARWSVRAGKRRAVLSYDYDYSGYAAARAAALEFVTGLGYAGVVERDGDYLDALRCYIVVCSYETSPALGGAR